jgi:ABC-2 type transport system permease protein
LSYKSGSFANKELKKQLEQGKKILLENHQPELKFAKDHPLFKVVPSISAYHDQILKDEYIGAVRIPKNYMESGDIDFIAVKNKALGHSRSIQKPLEKSLREALLSSIKNEKQKERVFDTLSLKLLTISKDSPDITGFNYHELVIPFLFLGMFILSISTASTFLLQSVSEEKEHRTIEILLSTLRPNQLITGKVLGLGSAALIQVLAWGAMAAMSIPVMNKSLGINLELSKIPTSHILYGGTVFLIAFLLFAAIMIGVGSLGANFKDAQQLGSFFLIGSFLPVYILQIIMTDIHGTLAKILYYFPITSPIVLVTRFCLGNLPLWESTLGILVLLFWAIAGLWFAAKAFRIGCLVFNRRPQWKEIRHALSS